MTFDQRTGQLAVTFFVLILLSGCADDVGEPDFSYAVYQPEHFPELAYDVADNPTTKAGFELGKKLFNDLMLSIDNSVACSNCHTKSLAFTDAQHNPSIGVFERAGSRNAPMIANMAFQREFMWDGGITHLDFVPVFAIENPKEMGESMPRVVHKLNRSTDYPSIFQSVFPEMDTITAPYMLKALSQYMLRLISDQSKYDQVQRGEAQFTDQEKEGQAIFNKACATCHSGPLMSNQDFMNNGLDTAFTDIGRGLITETEADFGKFKVPSLRNIMLTAPYMHDGRFASIDEVLDHYSHGVRHSQSLAGELIAADGSLGIALLGADKQKLIAFLHTLTDHDFVSRPEY